MSALAKLGMTAIIAASFSSVPALAALETTSDYSVLPTEEVQLSEYTGSVACTPVEPHYLPSFIRAPDGTVIGVGYIEISSDSAC